MNDGKNTLIKLSLKLLQSFKTQVIIKNICCCSHSIVWGYQLVAYIHKCIWATVDPILMSQLDIMVSFFTCRPASQGAETLVAAIR
jgi:hypothetical protein